MRLRYILLFLTLHFCFIQSLFGIMVTQVHFEGRVGREYTKCIDGYEDVSVPQRTFLCWDKHPSDLYKELGFWGIFSGQGTSSKKWYADFQHRYAEQFTRTSFSNWTEINKYDDQLDPADLAQKIQSKLKGFNCQGMLERLKQKIADIHYEFAPRSKYIKNSCSTSFLQLNANTMRIGVIGSNAALIGGLQASFSYQQPQYIINDTLIAANAKYAIGSQGFTVNDGKYIEIDLSDSEKSCFVVLMNDAVRECISDEKVCEIFNEEAHRSIELAKRVTQKIIDFVDLQHKKMFDDWNSIAQVNSVLKKPELGVGIVILNYPFKVIYNQVDKKCAQEEQDAVKIRGMRIKYSKMNQDMLLHRSTYDGLIRGTKNKFNERPKPSSFDEIFKWVTNKYVLGTMLTTALGYYTYLQIPSIKSFFSGFTKFFK